MRYIVLPIIVTLILLQGCSNSNIITDDDKNNYVTVYDILVNNGNISSQPPYPIENKYGNRTIYVKGMLSTWRPSSGPPSNGCRGDACSITLGDYRLILMDKSTNNSLFPSDVSARYLNVKYNGNELIAKSVPELFSQVKCKISLEPDKFYIFKGKPEIREYNAPDKDRLKLYWTGYFDIYECYELVDIIN